MEKVRHGYPQHAIASLIRLRATIKTLTTCPCDLYVEKPAEKMQHQVPTNECRHTLVLGRVVAEKNRLGFPQHTRARMACLPTNARTHIHVANQTHRLKEAQRLSPIRKSSPAKRSAPAGNHHPKGETTFNPEGGRIAWKTRRSAFRI